MDFMVDFGIDIHIPLQKKRVARAQLVATGGPWVTHQCLGNQILMIFLFFKAKIGPPQPEKSLNP